MKLETASALLPVVNAPNFEKAIADYVSDRLAEIHRAMERSQDESRWRQLQGHAAELELLSLLRRDVTAMLKRN